MRRRERTGVELVPLEHLVRFDLNDWPDLRPQPAWCGGGYPWRVFDARLRWVRARQQWLDEHGRSREALAALHGPDYARKGWYAR